MAKEESYSARFGGLRRRMRAGCAHSAAAVLASAAALALLKGCATVDVEHRGDRTVCKAENSVWVVFGRRVLASGDTAHPNESTCRWFADTLTREGNREVLDWAMRREGGTRVGSFEDKWYNSEVVPFVLRRESLVTYCGMWFGEDGKQGVPGAHACIGGGHCR